MLFSSEKEIVKQHKMPLADCRKRFVCPEESKRYAGALEQMVFSKKESMHDVVVEFGTGSGDPVISAVLNTGYMGTIHGYEINEEAAISAKVQVEEFGLRRQYVVHNESFFQAMLPEKVDYLIANPPYLPSAEPEKLILPHLSGGENGCDLSCRLLDYLCPNVLLLVSSYSDPARLLAHAETRGYRVHDFQVTKMSFGIYSQQDVVRARIHEMRDNGKAFFSDDCYLVGAALFSLDHRGPDLSREFGACLMSIKG